MRRIDPRLPLAALALCLVLTGCDSNGNVDVPPIGGAPTPTPTPPAPTPSPSPSPSPTPTALNVTRCVTQTAVPGRSVADLVVPDTIRVNLQQASGFPNGRRLQDPVVDVTLAVIFLDLTVHNPATLAGVPINPPSNDRAFLATFPYLAAPQGSPPIASTAGSRFRFRDDPASAYVRVDRMGMPAVATALINTPNKTAYNDDSPTQDATGKWVPTILSTLSGLATALDDDLRGAGLTPCAGP